MYHLRQQSSMDAKTTEHMDLHIIAKYHSQITYSLYREKCFLIIKGAVDKTLSLTGYHNLLLCTSSHDVIRSTDIIQYACQTCLI